jgi:hypothetical protein
VTSISKLSLHRHGQALKVPWGSSSQISRQSAHKGGQAVSHIHRPPLPPGNIPGAHFCQNLDPYLLTPWSRVLLEKLTSSQLVTKFPAFYGTPRFITAFTRARHMSLFWASSIQSMPSHPTSWRSILILFSCLRLVRPPLWSSGQSFWLQIQRSRVRSLALPDFLSSSGSGTGSTQPREVNWGATWIKK